MGSDGTADDIKGRLKEAAGALADDDDLKQEGRIDRATGKVKDAVDRIADKLKSSEPGKGNDPR